VEFLPEDQMWGEWLAEVMSNGGFAVRQRSLTEPYADLMTDENASDDERPRGMTVTVVSAAYLARRGDQPVGQSERAVYVTVTQPLPEFASGTSVFLAGVSEDEAIDRLHDLLGITGRHALPQSAIPAANHRSLG
jgi:hypothetical protein